MMMYLCYFTPVLVANEVLLTNGCTVLAVCVLYCAWLAVAGLKLYCMKL